MQDFLHLFMGGGTLSFSGGGGGRDGQGVILVSFCETKTNSEEGLLKCLNIKTHKICTKKNTTIIQTAVNNSRKLIFSRL